VVAVDYDPVTLRIGQGALGDFAGRLSWVDAKLGSRGWTDRLPQRRFDAAVSTTALHWLPRDDLRALYRDLGRLIRRGGVFLNGDHIPWGGEDRRLNHLAEAVRRQHFRGTPLSKEWTAWRDWWKRAEKVPGLAPYFAERQHRSAQHPRTGEISLEVHVEALRRAGFRDVGVIWQYLTNRVLFARR
jgi:SAM-dependent methyltransferase